MGKSRLTELSLTWPQILSWRMRRSQLVTPSNDGIATMSEQLVGVQAQLMSSAELALSIRTKAKPNDVRTSLWKKREVVKTWTQRGTLHLITPEDLGLFVGAMKQRGEYWATGAWERYHGVSAKEMRLILEGLDDALGHDCLTREELAASLGKVMRKPALAKAVMNSWGATIKPAAFHGKLVFGPNKGRNVTFVSPQVWLKKWKPVDGDEALGELVFRYLDTYGPSTQDDFTRWLGVEPKIGRRAIQLVKDELVAVDVEKTNAYLTPWGAKDIAKVAKKQSIAVLPAYDPYVVGVLKHLDRVVPKPDQRAEVSRAAGRIAPTIVVDGRITGIWNHKRTPKAVTTELKMLTKVDSATTQAIEKKLAAMAKLMHAVPEEDVAGSEDPS